MFLKTTALLFWDKHIGKVIITLSVFVGYKQPYITLNCKCFFLSPFRLKTRGEDQGTKSTFGCTEFITKTLYGGVQSYSWLQIKSPIIPITDEIIRIVLFGEIILFLHRRRKCTAKRRKYAIQPLNWDAKAKLCSWGKRKYIVFKQCNHIFWEA